MRTAKETFYFVEDVMKMLGLSRSKAYSIIKQFCAGQPRVLGHHPQRDG